MNKKDALKLLAIYRKNQDFKLDGEFQEALDFVAHDATLKEAFETEQSFDEEFRESLRTIAPPDHLHSKILQTYQEQKLIEFEPSSSKPWSRWLHFSSFGAAAAIVILLALNFTFWNPPAQASLDPSLSQIIQQTEQNLSQFGPRMKSNELSKLASFLRSHGKDLPTSIPPKLRLENSFACDVFEVNGVKVGLLCIKKDDTIYHLFSFNANEVPAGQKLNSTIFGEISNKNCATWREDDTVYYLLSSCSKEKFRDIVEI